MLSFLEVPSVKLFYDWSLFRNFSIFPRSSLHWSSFLKASYFTMCSSFLESPLHYSLYCSSFLEASYNAVYMCYSFLKASYFTVYSTCVPHSWNLIYITVYICSSLLEASYFTVHFIVLLIPGSPNVMLSSFLEAAYVMIYHSWGPCDHPSSRVLCMWILSVSTQYNIYVRGEGPVV
jgi:hypothetical protein